MVKVLTGDLFESKAQTLVNTVNCVGVMGKGVALEFKVRFPEMFDDYLRRCGRGEIQLGRPYLYKSLIPPWILNFPTKDHWRSISRIEDIIRGLEYVLKHYREWGITSLAVPPLGCGHGQLDWKVVGPTLYRHLKRLDIPVKLYAPYGTPNEELELDFLEAQQPSGRGLAHGATNPQWVKPGWVALVEILRRLEAERYHWPVGRTMFQKIVYVATEEGLPTGLSYRRGSYGPFCPQLKSLITRLVNNGLISEQRLGSLLAIKVGRTFEDARAAYMRDLQLWESTIERIADLFTRLHTKQAELVATILFVADMLADRKNDAPTESEVLGEVMTWKRRRRPPLDETELGYTIRNLAALGWLKVKPSADLPVPSDV